jgi:2-polyprenyl-6-methoxyphenol hydroxylase-like FAD-dependent oxidoreductase
MAAPPELPESTEILIIGAGATGLALAATLAARGRSFAIIDKLPERSNFSRAIGTIPLTLEMLQPLGVAEQLAGMGNRARLARFYSGDRDREFVKVRFDRLSTRFPYVLLMPQHFTETVLETRLRELNGAEVHRPYVLTGIEQDGKGVVATVTGAGPAEGETRTIRADYVVGADGARSTVRELLAVRFPGDTCRQTFMLHDLRLKDGPPNDEIQMFCSRLGAVTMGAIPPGIVRATISVDDPPASPEGPTVAQVQALIDERAPAHYRPEVLEVLHSGRSRVHHRLADRFRVGRVFLAGDAAHSNSPVSGQGMNLGIQDGIILGDLLATSLATGRDLLDDYERRRRPIAKEAIGMTRRMHQISTEAGPVTGGLRDRLFPLANLSVLNRRVAYQLSGLGRRPVAATQKS